MNNNQDEFSTPLDARTPRTGMNEQPNSQNGPIEQSPMPQPMPQNAPIQQEPMQQVGQTPPVVPPPVQVPQSQQSNNKKESKDLPLIIVGLILIISVPIIFFYVSKRQDNLVVVRCNKENSEQPLISYGVDSYFNNFDVKSMEYSIIYDVKSLENTEALEVREEMEDLGKEYESKHKVEYIVEKVSDKLVLRIYANKDLVKNYFNVDYGTNKTFIVDYLEESDFKCEEEKVK